MLVPRPSRACAAAFSLGGGARVPIYALIGATLAFSLTFATAELLNYAAGAGGSGIGGGSGGGAARANAAPVQTPTQVVLLAVASILLGLAYGIMFGTAEIGRGVFTLHTLRVRRRRGLAGGRAARAVEGESASPHPLPSCAQTQFIHEERLCLPVGALAGAITGYLNELWRPVASAGGDEKRGLDGFGAEGGSAARRDPADDFEPFRDSDSSTAAKNF